MLLLFIRALIFLFGSAASGKNFQLGNPRTVCKVDHCVVLGYPLIDSGKKDPVFIAGFALSLRLKKTRGPVFLSPDER